MPENSRMELLGIGDDPAEDERQQLLRQKLQGKFNRIGLWLRAFQRSIEHFTEWTKERANGWRTYFNIQDSSAGRVLGFMILFGYWMGVASFVFLILYFVTRIIVGVLQPFVGDVPVRYSLEQSVDETHAYQIQKSVGGSNNYQAYTPWLLGGKVQQQLEQLKLMYPDERFRIAQGDNYKTECYAVVEKYLFGRQRHVSPCYTDYTEAMVWLARFQEAKKTGEPIEPGSYSYWDYSKLKLPPPEYLHKPEPEVVTKEVEIYPPPEQWVIAVPYDSLDDLEWSSVVVEEVSWGDIEDIAPYDRLLVVGAP